MCFFGAIASACDFSLDVRSGNAIGQSSAKFVLVAEARIAHMKRHGQQIAQCCLLGCQCSGDNAFSVFF